MEALPVGASALSESLYDLVPSTHSHHTTHPDTTQPHTHSREDTVAPITPTASHAHSTQNSSSRLTVLSPRSHNGSTSRGK